MKGKWIAMLAILCTWLPLAQASETVLRVGQQKGLTKAMLEAAGQLEDLPYRLEWAEFAASAFTLEAMGADQIDVATVGDGPLIFAAGAGAPIRPIASVRLVDRSEGNVILVRNDSGINSIADLRGKRIATTRGSSGHQLLLAALQQAGMSTADVQLSLLAPADGKSAFDAHAVDAWAIWQPYVAIARSRGDVKVLINSNGLLSEYGFVAANENAIGNKRAALDDFIKRLDAATRWSDQHEQAYLDIQSRLTGLSVEILRSVRQSMSPEIGPLTPAAVAGLQQTLTLYRDTGLLRRELGIGDFFDAALVERYRSEQPHGHAQRTAP